jgi:protein tyrosine phosphatase (PTP) superfamily phosphohydrolase (DUF442 family)
MPEWVDGLQGTLARSWRPGYNSREVPVAIVDCWLAEVKAMGVRSIICLATDDQLAYYRDVPPGLPNYCREHGFTVAHRPVIDPAHDPERGQHDLREALAEIFELFSTLPKPVLIHCSPGTDRTGAAVNYVVEHTDA